jgi:hypothetical protein
MDKWTVINKGVVPFQKGIIGKKGGERPHISFFVDEDKDIRIAIWDLGNGTASYQITTNNQMLETPTPVNVTEDVIPVPSNYQPSQLDDDDLPF